MSAHAAEIKISLGGSYGLIKGLTGSTPALLAAGLACTAATFGAVIALAPKGTLIHDVFLVSPAIAATQTALFFLGGAMLLGKLADLMRERAVLGAPLTRLLAGGADAGSIDRSDAGAVLGRLSDLQPMARESVVVNRIDKSLRRLHITGSTGELGTILSELSELDQNRFDSGHVMIRFLLAVIPITGFIGTVLGISLAISGFPAMLEGGEGIEALQEPIVFVTQQLGLAFNTTLLALVQAGLLMFFQALVQRKEEGFLNGVNEFCISQILNRVRMESEGVQFKEAIEREMQDLRLVLAEQSEDLLLSFQEMINGVKPKAR